MKYTGAEIIRIAIGEEKDAIAFYRLALENCDDPRAEAVFQFLLREEETHLHFLEKDMLPAFDQAGFSWEDEDMIVSYLRSTGKSGALEQEAGEAREFARTHNDVMEVIDFAITMEKKAIAFYKNVRAASSGSGHEALDRVIKEEAGHARKLYEVRKSLSDVPDKTVTSDRRR